MVCWLRQFVPLDLVCTFVRLQLVVVRATSATQHNPYDSRPYNSHTQPLQPGVSEQRVGFPHHDFCIDGFLVGWTWGCCGTIVDRRGELVGPFVCCVCVCVCVCVRVCACVCACVCVCVRSYV